MSKLKGILLTQGMHGMISQVEGLAKALDLDFTHHKVELSSFWKMIPPKYTPISKNVYNKINQNEFDVIISCGRKSVIPSIHLKNTAKKRVFNIHIQDPKISHKFFDLIVCPEHDNLNFDNCISTLLAIHNIKFKKNIRSKNTINFIIGGPNKYFKFQQQTQEKILNEIKFLSNEFKVNVIPSRRTPRGLIEELSKIDNENIVAFDDLFNPRKYGELLSEGNLQVVTWDSISMISEAISSEAGTFLFKFEENFCPKRYHKFFDKITELNFAQFYNQNLKPYEISINEYNKNLKTKILNKIQSNLRFRSNNA